MSKWLGKTLPVSPRLCLLGDRSQVHNVSRDEFTTAARTILRYWKSTKLPEVKECVNYLIKTASYESALTRMTNCAKGPI